MGLFHSADLSPWPDWLPDVLKKGGRWEGGNSFGKFYGQFSLPKSFLCTKTWENIAENQLQRMWLSWDNQALGKSDAPGSAVPCCALEGWLTPEATHPFHPQPPVQNEPLSSGCLSYCPSLHQWQSSTKTCIWAVALEVTSSFTSAWPAKYLFTNSLFKPELSLIRSRHSSSGSQYDSNFHHLGWTHQYVRHRRFATCAGNTSVALKQEMGVTASPWLKFCIAILPRFNLGFCNVNALPAIIGQKWKPDQCNYSSQLSHDLGWNKTGPTWLPDVGSGERSKNGFPANKICRP